MTRFWKTGLVSVLALGVLSGCAATGTGSGADTGGAPASEAPAPPPPSPPPPPPPPPPPAMSGAMESVAVTASRRDMATAAKTSPVRPIPGIAPEPEKPQPEPQSGMLTAGDYDDVLNPDLYKAYLDRMLQGELKGKDLPFVDANQRIEITVKDRLGKAVPLANLALTTAKGEPMFPLRTGADGKAYLYPNYDALETGMIVTVSAPNAGSLRQSLSAEQLSGGGVIDFTLPSDRTAATKLDLLLTLDATGSMSDEMRYLQTELVAILDRVKAANPGLDIHAGLIVYRDKGDEYVSKEFGFTPDLASFKAKLGEQSAGGGGDMPEAMQIALENGLAFDWRADAIKVNLLVADAPPHDQDIAATWDSGLISRSRGIHIVPIAASGVDKTAEFLMRGMAQLTGGRYLFLTDDSGIGNAHAEPTVDCYAVTRLDSLVQRVLESLISGTRVEPEGDEVIRTVGNYQAGVCKIDPKSGAKPAKPGN